MRVRAAARGTHDVLALLARHPGRRAADLAAQAGVETAVFKRRVRRLKELGLTRSLEVGYELSPRGSAWMRAAAPSKQRRSGPQGG